MDLDGSILLRGRENDRLNVFLYKNLTSLWKKQQIKHVISNKRNNIPLITYI